MKAYPTRRVRSQISQPLMEKVEKIMPTLPRDFSALESPRNAVDAVVKKREL
jgi:hypothetical protein